MRGRAQPQQNLFIYRSLDQRVPEHHPLRPVRAAIDAVVAELEPTFAAMYADVGRPSIPPEHLLKALVLQILYSIRSERQLVEQLEFNLLYRWFLGLDADADVWDHSTFSLNRQRFEAAGLDRAFFEAVVAQADAAGLLSHDHFTVDGTLLEAAASHKSFQRKDEPPDAGGGSSRPPESGRNPAVDFHGERRTNATHASTSDPDARYARKGAGKEARPSYQANVLMENRHGLIVGTDVRLVDGHAEVDGAVDLLIDAARPQGQTQTVGADKGYDRRDFVEPVRALGITPHVAQKAKGSAIDARTTTPPGYAISQQKRKLVEQGFGWGKTIGLLRKLRHRGLGRVQAIFRLTCAVYNLVRLRTLVPTG